MKIVAVIPARYASTRFPGKLLQPLHEKTILRHVYERVYESHLFDEIIIATDDVRIAEHAAIFQAKVAMTSSQHKSGTDRIAEAIKGIHCNIVVNVQGDEPFISKEPLQLLIDSFADTNVEISTLITELDSSQITNPNAVKVVIDKYRNAIYFSRAPIPFNRDKTNLANYFQHIGVYAYRRYFLEKFVAMPQGELEKIEQLEQLRILENGFKIRTVKTNYDGFGIDTREDLTKARMLLTTKKV